MSGYRSYRSNSYSGDPRYITAKFNSTCKCGAQIKKGDNIYYYPLTKTALCPKCSESASAEFESAKFDEQMYETQYGSYL